MTLYLPSGALARHLQVSFPEPGLAFVRRAPDIPGRLRSNEPQHVRIGWPGSQGARSKSRARGRGLAGRSPAVLSWARRREGGRGQGRLPRKGVRVRGGSGAGGWPGWEQSGLDGAWASSLPWGGGVLGLWCQQQPPSQVPGVQRPWGPRWVSLVFLILLRDITPSLDWNKPAQLFGLPWGAGLGQSRDGPGQWGEEGSSAYLSLTF